jgi:chromosome segregation ATPase
MMASAARFAWARVLLLLAAPAAGARLQARRADRALESPVVKVITLLEDLVTAIEGEGQTEASSYDEFACFCKSKTEDKSESVKTSQDTIDSLSAAIEESSATVAEKEGELSERKQKQEELTGELDELKTRCSAELAEYEAVIADYAKALDQLDKALSAMEASKPASLVELRRTVDDALALAPALGASLGAAQRKAVQALVQESVDPDDPDYKFQSKGIIETLEGLQKTFTEKKDEEHAALEKSKQTCEELETSLTEQMDENNGFMETLRTDIDTLKEQVATDRTSLIQEEATLKDDQLYLKDLTERCEARARDWDQRSQLRGGELRALAGALSILKEGKDGGASVEAIDAEVNQRALLQRGNSSDRVLLLANAAKASSVRLIGDTPLGRKLLQDTAPSRAVAAHARRGPKVAVRRQPASRPPTARQPAPAATAAPVGAGGSEALVPPGG